MTDETIKVTKPKATKPSVTEAKRLPHFDELRELKVWLMKLSDEDREAVSDKVNKIAPTLK